MKTSVSTKKGFLSRKRVGLILRTFAAREDDVQNRVNMTSKIVKRALGITVDGQSVIKRIDVLIWADKRYPDSDCGKTTEAIKDNLANTNLPDIVHIREVTRGDLFCGILNFGIAMQSRNRIDYSIIASPESYDFLNNETIEAMVEAACDGALAIGVAINEITQSILEGRIGNAFSMWHNISLQSVGGFDLRAAKPKEQKSARYMRGWHKDQGDVYYHLAGVEEMIPLAWLVDSFGECIAPILPRGKGVQRYIQPDPEKQPELYQRHVSKIGTKLERQSAHLAEIGYHPSFLQGGVMPKYCTF